MNISRSPRPNLKIGIVSPYSLSLPGGVQGQVLGLARALRGRGVDARVLGPCDGPPPEVGVTPLGASLPTATSANGSVAPIAPDFAALLRTLRALRNERFDVLHLHEPFVPGPPSTALMAAEVPIVGTFHAAGKQPLYSRGRLLARWAGKRITYATAVSDDAAELVKEVVRIPIRVMGNGVDMGRFRRDQGTPRHDPAAVLFVGRHEERKGLATLLQAIAGIEQDFVVWIVGSGPQTEGLRAATNDPRVRWLGRINDVELVARMRTASCFVAPSLGGESFGVVLLEAMAAGLPLIASDIDGYRNVADNEREALLVPPGDVHALAKAIDRVLSQPTLVQSLVTAGNRRAEQHSLDALAGEYEAIYRAVLADSAATGAPTRRATTRRMLS